jgi:hypothetical protein
VKGLIAKGKGKVAQGSDFDMKSLAGPFNLFPRVLGPQSSAIPLSLQSTKPSSGGEVVSGTNYVYHSLDLMAPILNKDQDLSMD